MPEGWIECRLEDICSDGGSIQTGPFGSQLHASDYQPFGVPVVMPFNIGDNHIVESKVARVAESEAVRLSRHRVRVGDIVYSRRGDITLRALIRQGQVGWLCGTGCLLVRSNSNVDSEWLSYWLGTPKVHEWLKQRAVGATMPNLNTRILAELPVLLPSPAEQQRISGVLGAIDRLIEINLRLADRSNELAFAIAGSAPKQTQLSALATLSEVTVTIPVGRTDHFSLPAFDVDRLPARVDGSSIKSHKLIFETPLVLVSRLNPHIPRVWMAYPDRGYVSAASTEFVPFVGNGVHTEEVWAVCARQEFLEQMNSLVTGTTGSHQRVDKAALLRLAVPDVRQLSKIGREAVVKLVQEGHAARTQVRNLTDTRNELLPLLLSGAITVKETAA